MIRLESSDAPSSRWARNQLETRRNNNNNKKITRQKKRRTGRRPRRRKTKPKTKKKQTNKQKQQQQTNTHTHTQKKNTVPARDAVHRQSAGVHIFCTGTTGSAGQPYKVNGAPYRLSPVAAAPTAAAAAAAIEDKSLRKKWHLVDDETHTQTHSCGLCVCFVVTERRTVGSR